jgi:hypothetical protein
MGFNTLTINQYNAQVFLVAWLINTSNFLISLFLWMWQQYLYSFTSPILALAVWFSRDTGSTHPLLEDWRINDSQQDEFMIASAVQLDRSLQRYMD